MTDYIVKTNVDRKLERGLCKEELSHWTGSATRTTSVTDRDGVASDLSLFDWVGVDVYAQEGARTGAAIDSAQDGIYNRAALFLAPGAWNITANLTVNASAVLTVPPGATIDVLSGVTLTINGYFNAGIYQVFTGDGTVVFGSGAVADIYPEWWGIDGVDDQVEINKAMTSCNSLGGTVRLTKRGKTNDYTISDTIDVAEGVHLVGVAVPTAGSADTMGTYITATSSVVDYAVDVNDSRGTLIENLYVDIENANDSASGFAIRDCLNITMNNCTAIGVWKTNQNGFYIEDGANRGPWQMRFERCVVVGKSTDKLGNGFYVLGQLGTSHHSGKITFDGCWVKHTYNGFNIDYFGSGMNFINCQAEECGNDGAVFTNHNAGLGPPLFIGGEFNSNTGYGINGKVTTLNLSMNNNGTDAHGDVCRLRQYTQGANNDNYWRVSKAIKTPGLITTEATKQTITAASDTITVPSQMVKRLNYVSDPPGTPITLTSTPTIEATDAGKWLILYHRGNDSIILQDNALLDGSDLKLHRAGNTLTMSYGDTACFYYETTTGDGETPFWQLFWYSGYSSSTQEYTVTDAGTQRTLDADAIQAQDNTVGSWDDVKARLDGFADIIEVQMDVLGTLIEDLAARHIIALD